MIKHPEFVMLHLQKVAGTHLTKFLLNLYEDAWQEGLHGALKVGREKYRFNATWAS